MKKGIGIILLVTAVVAVVGVFYFQQKKAVDSVFFAEFLPQDTLVTISVPNLNRLSDEFGASPLGRLLAKETMTDILKDFKLPSRDIGEYNRLYDDVASVMNNPAFRAVFGDNVSLGILRPELTALEKEPEKELRRIMLLFAGSSVSGALEQFARLVMSEQVSEETVDGVSLTRIVLDEQSVMYGYAENGKVLLAFDPHTVTGGLKVREARSGLDSSSPFREALGFLQPYAPERVLFRMFFNPQVLRALFMETGEPEVEELAGYLTGIRFFASVTSEEQDELRSLARAGFTPGELHALVKAAIAGQAAGNTTLHMLKEKCLVYDWASTLVPEVLVQSIGTVSESEVQQANDLLQRELGVSLDELFEAFGPQYGFVVNEIINGGFIPIPKVVGFVQVRDHAVAGKVFDHVRRKIADSGFAEEQQMVVNGETVYYWSVLPGEATQPAMVLTGDMLYLANGKSVLAQMLRAEAPRDKLNPQVAELIGKQTSRVVENARLGAFVIYPARLADEVGEVAQWLMNTVSAAKGVSVERLGSEILELMRAYEVLSAASSLGDEYGEWQVSLKRKAAKGEE